MTEAFGVAALRYIENKAFGVVDKLTRVSFLAVRLFRDLGADVDEVSEQTLFLDDLCIVLDVQCIGDRAVE